MYQKEVSGTPFDVPRDARLLSRPRNRVFVHVPAVASAWSDRLRASSPGVVYFPEMHDRQARAILEARVEAGGKLVVGQEADWISIKRLQIQCHEAGVPTVLGNCPSGG